ncbi:MAG TPA: long-chain-fatty-acid--CoA ligase [bacterium]|nr:long-chain-fatty-acid--CoA ligase [bacterium]
MNLSELLKDNINRFGEYPLLHFGGRDITNAELMREINGVAAGLARMGVKPGDRVALVTGNSPEVIVAMFACFKLGAWAMPVVLSLRPPELALILNDAEPSTLIAQRAFIDRIQEPVKETRGIAHRVVIGKGPAQESWTSWDDLPSGGPAGFEARDCEPDEIALLLYTSGTTGSPKGVMLSHMNLYSSAINGARSQGLRQGDVNLLALPLNHSFGITAWLAALVYGMQVVLMPRFDPVETFRVIEKHKVQSTALVPTMMAFMLEVPDRDKHDLSSLTRIVSGGSPLTLKLRERMAAAYPRIQVLEAYGLTEASPGVSVTRPDREIRDRSVGQSIENQEIRVMDDRDRALGPGEVGEVCTRGPHVMAGYYKRPDETAAVIRDGWLHTGDLGYLDEDGYLYLTGRLKDMIIRGGVNVYPADVERVLRAHPAVVEAAVIGVPDEVYGEEIAAVVVKKPGSPITAETLIQYCMDNLAPFQVPKRVVFTQILPKSSMGKIKKKDLKDQFGGTIGSGD